MACSFSKTAVFAAFGLTNGTTMRRPLSEWKRFNIYSRWRNAACYERKWRRLIHSAKQRRPSRMQPAGNVAVRLFSNLRRSCRGVASKMVRSLSPRLFFLLGLACSLAVRHVECATAPEPGDLRAAGKVEFPVSCAPSVQSEFSCGVALLHSFFYEEARRVFTSVADRKSTRLNSSHPSISYAVFCSKK